MNQGGLIRTDSVRINAIFLSHWYHICIVEKTAVGVGIDHCDDLLLSVVVEGIEVT